jgi:hypothetical protein
MADLSIRPASECRFDAVSLGEVMLRLDPGEGRIRVTVGLARATAWCSARYSPRVLD